MRSATGFDADYGRWQLHEKATMFWRRSYLRRTGSSAAFPPCSCEMCLDVSIPMRIIWSMDDLLSFRSATTSFWHSHAVRGPSTLTDPDHAMHQSRRILLRHTVRPHSCSNLGRAQRTPSNRPLRQQRRRVDRRDGFRPSVLVPSGRNDHGGSSV
jgi:hypothetical protein